MLAAKSKVHFVWLSSDVRSDLTWWDKFLKSWNGVGILPTAEMPKLTLFTDASGKWSCAGIGALNGSNGNGGIKQNSGTLH